MVDVPTGRVLKMVEFVEGTPAVREGGSGVWEVAGAGASADVEVGEEEEVEVAM
jgi:hypothetical protein